ncbi:DUF2272 domain-containing protein [Alteromonas aestuariivivens]|uniref:DUF2272 domain-containing protein n=1 Tax=Alteromonas aestuariivivens TaxID=1938339 RepID=A0A3D8M4I2_9ALTE|nr:DUF2272 domain-containing protein [Alteromonas aestuariivivens]RDV24599.1 DUF2272 domain-containing protein [Alteromonas aestuariivivens]
MAATLTVTVQPKTAITDPDSISQTLFARLKYLREVPSEDVADGAPSTSNIEGSLREELDAEGKTSLTAEDYSAGSAGRLQIESAQGAVLWTSDEFTLGDAEEPIAVSVPNAVYGAAQKRTPSASPTLLRAGRFVRLDDTLPDFSGYRLFVAAIRPAEIDGNTNPQTAAVRKVLGLNGNGEVTSFEVTTVNPKKLDPEAVNALAFQNATIRLDGAFDISIDVKGDEIAWLWLLLGRQNYTGYQLDPVPVERRPASIIMLPFEATSAAGDASTPVTPETDSDTEADHSCCKHSSIPMEYDEQQLVDHPGMFSDDPGKFCSPFENPQRILGEKRFFTVLRIDQPEIGGQGSLKISRPILLDLAPPIKMTAVASAFEAAREENGGIPLNALTTINTTRLTTATAAQPRLDFRRLIDTAIFKPSRIPWTDWVRKRSKARMPVSASNPIEWDGDPTIYQAATVAGGHILEWRVQWRSNGYSLGNVAHTLTLAPRQTKRISKISWQRREQAVRRERTEATDALTQVTTRARDYTDAVQSSLSEWSKGGSKSRSTGVAGGIGFAMGPVVIGGGAAHGRASSSSWQSGGRRVAAAEQQQLRDAIRQYGESLRSLESTVITELSQQEEVEGVSETLRNVNHCHALTVLYYEILRHLRVDTAFGGVRECLYVPFSVTPFDLDKALKWRDKLFQGMLDRSLRWALDRLDEVASAWADSDIPPGRRSQHPINHLTGSVYIQLSIERIREQTEQEALEDYEQLWRPFSPLLGFPVRRIIETIRQAERERDAYFQREVAPTMASRWTDRLELVIGGSVVSDADFTLASSYRFGQVVRVDFTAALDGSLNREQLQEITVRSSQALPRGSVANVKRVALHYYTAHFDRQVQSDSGTRDLVSVATGLPDAGAVAHFRLSAWERENLREMIERGVEKLILHLNANLVYYHKVIWWLMDRDELYMMLDGFTAPYGRRFEDGSWVEDPGRSLASVVERDPVAILGNSLVFRVAAGAFLGIDGHESPDAAHRYYYDSQVRTEPLRVSLPTEGLYAQALMDKCEATEEHNGSTDWVLTDQDPELEAIADQLSSRRAAPENLTPTNLPDTIISLQNAPAAPDPSGLAGVLGAVTKGDAFRDMAGLAGTQANAAAALQTAANMATSFGQKAVDFQKSKFGTDSAKKKLDNIKKAESSGLIDKADAKKQAAKVLDEQNMTPDSIPLTEQSTIQKAMQNAASTGQSIEATRQSKEGTESVKIAAEGPLLASLPGANNLKRICGFFGPAAVASETEVRDKTVAESNSEHSAWASNTAGRLEEDNNDQFGRLVAYSLCRFAALPPDALKALYANATDPATVYGNLTSATATTAQLNTAIANARATLLTGVPTTHTPANLSAIIDNALREAWDYSVNTTAWSAAFISYCVRNAAIELGIEAMSGSTHVGSDELLIPTGRHATYVLGAYRRRFGPGQATGTYQAFEISEREPKIGDIIVQDRHGSVVSFNNIPTTLAGGRKLHADIIVEADPGNDYVIAIGGNVDQSVRKRRYPLDATRHLVVERTQLYTQEEDNGNLPPVPAANPALTGLDTQSTGRIFALLSPVESCAVIPGQAHNGGIIT